MYNLLVSSVVVLISSYLLPGVHVSGFTAALVTAVFLGLVNSFIGPIIQFLAFPITLLTLGIFSFVINGLLVLLVSNIVPGFKVDSLWSAILFSIIMSLLGMLLGVHI